MSPSKPFSLCICNSKSSFAYAEMPVEESDRAYGSDCAIKFSNVEYRTSFRPIVNDLQTIRRYIEKNHMVVLGRKIFPSISCEPRFSIMVGNVRENTLIIQIRTDNEKTMSKAERMKRIAEECGFVRIKNRNYEYMYDLSPFASSYGGGKYENAELAPFTMPGVFIYHLTPKSVICLRGDMLEDFLISLAYRGDDFGTKFEFRTSCMDIVMEKYV